MAEKDFKKEDIYELIFESKSEIEKELIQSEFINKAVSLGLDRETIQKNIEAYENKYAQVSKDNRQFITIKNKDNEDIKLALPLSYYYTNSSINKFGFDGKKNTVISHMIYISCIFQNVEDSKYKIEITYKRGGRTNKLIVSKDTISNVQNIVKLSNYGISVTTENAKKLISFLQAFEDTNYNIIPKKRSISRLGWHGKAFVPFTSTLTIDNEEFYKPTINSLKNKGNIKAWIDGIKDIRKNNKSVKIAIAVAFSSVLLKPLHMQNFICHLWGKSGTGKTLLIYLCASIWGNPVDYTQTFSSTLVGMINYSKFICNLPLILDELQLIKDKEEFDNYLYALTEGKEKLKGTASGELSQNIGGKWNYSVLTTGESPITTYKSGGGAINRVIEIRLNSSITDNPEALDHVIKNNYGVIGKDFLDKLKEKSINIRKQREKLRAIKQNLILRYDTLTEKQINIISIILLTDNIISHLYFNGQDYLQDTDIIEYVSDNDEVSNEARAYDYLIETISANPDRFNIDSQFEIWGVDNEEDECIYIIRKYFNSILSRNGYDPQGLLYWLDEQGKLNKGKTTGYNFKKRINGSPINCIKLIKD